jgi:hypothetical protein
VAKVIEGESSKRVPFIIGRLEVESDALTMLSWYTRFVVVRALSMLNTSASLWFGAAREASVEDRKAIRHC